MVETEQSRVLELSSIVENAPYVLTRGTRLQLVGESDSHSTSHSDSACSSDSHSQSNSKAHLEPVVLGYDNMVVHTSCGRTATSCGVAPSILDTYKHA